MSDGLVGCGLDKVKVFTECIVPPLREFFGSDPTMLQNNSILVDKVLERIAK